MLTITAVDWLLTFNYQINKPYFLIFLCIAPTLHPGMKPVRREKCRLSGRTGWEQNWRVWKSGWRRRGRDLLSFCCRWHIFTISGLKLLFTSFLYHLNITLYFTANFPGKYAAEVSSETKRRTEENHSAGATGNTTNMFNWKTVQLLVCTKKTVTIYFTQFGYLLQLTTCRRGKLVGN